MANLHKLPLDDWRDWRVARNSHAKGSEICSHMVRKHRNLLLSNINWYLSKLDHKTHRIMHTQGQPRAPCKINSIFAFLYIIYRAPTTFIPTPSSLPATHQIMAQDRGWDNYCVTSTAVFFYGVCKNKIKHQMTRAV